MRAGRESSAGFDEMSRAQARDYLEQFVAELPRSRDRLARMLTAAGADPSIASDPSEEGLDALWEVALTSLPMEWREGYVPHDYTKPRLRPEPSPGPPVASGDLPSWVIHERTDSIVLSPDTLWVADVLARHLGQVAVSAYPHLSWTSGPSRPATNIDRHRPVVGGGKGWFAPLRLVNGLLRRTIENDPQLPGPRTLRVLYELNTMSAAEW